MGFGELLMFMFALGSSKIPVQVGAARGRTLVRTMFAIERLRSVGRRAGFDETVAKIRCGRNRTFELGEVVDALDERVRSDED